MAETPSYRRLGAKPESPAPGGETLNHCAFTLNLIQDGPHHERTTKIQKAAKQHDPDQMTGSSAASTNAPVPPS